jgi:predicted RNase H-related nuclease YkuK (DUF458 family)
MRWYTGSGKRITFESISKLAFSHHNNDGTVHIGTDSHIKQSKCIFSIAICLIGNTKKTPNRYFITCIERAAAHYPTLLQRMVDEVQKSVNMGLTLLNYCPKIDIELHLDISAAHKNETTSKFSNMLVGVAQGSGFECKIKPNAFAASSVADRYNKHPREIKIN